MVWTGHLGVATDTSSNFVITWQANVNDPSAATWNAVAVRRFEPTAALVLGGYVCTRGVASPDRFGPGNVGVGTLGGADTSNNVLSVLITVERWYGGADLGPDGQPCTDDDPGLAADRVTDRTFTLSLGTPVCCGDCNGDGRVTIDEVVRVANESLRGCPNTSR